MTFRAKNLAGSEGDTDITDQFTYNAADNLYTRETTGLASESLLFVFADKNALGIDDGEITWTAVVTGEVPDACSADIGMDGMSLEVTVDKNTTQESQSYYGDPMGYNVSAIVSCPAGYTYKLWFNGIDYTSKFTEDNGYRIEDEEELRSQVVDGTWVVEFKKKDITWNLKVIGEIPEGAKADSGLDGLSLEVLVVPGQTSDTDSLEYSEGGYNVSLYVEVPAGYTFTLLGNGKEVTLEELSTNSQGITAWSASFSDAEHRRLYSVDTDWIVAFRKINDYDVNGDGTISIADVTKLVNVILGKE